MARLLSNCVHDRRLALILTLRWRLQERTLTQWRGESVDTWPAAPAHLDALHASRVGHLEKVAEPDELIFVYLHLLVHLVELCILNVLLGLGEVLVFPVHLVLELLDLLLEGHDKECFSLIALGCLDNWCQCARVCCIFLSVLDELILLKKVFNGSLLAAVFILEDPDLRLQLHVLLSVRVSRLLVLDDLHLELFGEFGLLGARRCNVALTVE